MMEASSSLELSSINPRRTLDSDDIESGTGHSGVISVVDIGVGGMTCSMCSSAIHKALSGMDGVIDVTVSLATNVAHVEYIESETLTAQVIADEIEDIGYDVNDVIEKKKSTRTLKTVEYAVGGMTCSMCSSAVHRALTSMAGVEEVDVSLSTNIARIKYYDDDQVQNESGEVLDYPNDFGEMIEDIGYDVNDVVNQFTNESNNNNNNRNDEFIFDESEDRLQRILRQQDSQLMARRKAFLWSFAGTVPILIITMVMPRVLHKDNFVCQFFKQHVDIFGCSLLVEAIVVWLLTTPVQFICGYSFYKTSFHGIRRGVLGMDVLVSIGTTSSYIYAFLSMWKNDPGYRFFETSAVLITFVLLGKWMNALAVRKTSQALTQLMKLQSKTAIKITTTSTSLDLWNPLRDPYTEETVPIQNVHPGDIVKILRGSNIPADGVVLHGEMTVDQSMITGESIPVLKSPGDDVLGGTICAETGIASSGKEKDHALTAAAFVRVTGVGADSALSQIVQMVQEAQSKQVPIQKLADSIASVFVPVVVVFSFLTFLAWLACCKTGIVPIGWYGDENPIAFSLMFGIASLVISCPCALGLATPTAVMVGTGVGASHGILMKGGETLEVASKANVVLFDKTGTLTRGKPAVTDFTRVASDEFLRSLMSGQSMTSGMSPDDFLVWLLGSLERNSEHILATAIVKFTEQKIENLLRSKPLSQPTDFVAMTGRGASGLINGNIKVAIGNRSFAERENMSIPQQVEDCLQRLESEGKTAIIAGINGTACAVLGIADEIKSEAPKTVRYLKKLGMDVWMVTGDSKRTAHAIARQLDLPEDRVIAEALPTSKIDQVRKLQQQSKIVCMVGDGVNDAPALAEADVGISMGTGSDIAAEASDMVLVAGNVAGVCTALHLSRAIFKRIQLNFAFSMGYNIFCIPLAAGVLFPFFQLRLPPTVAAIAMALSSVSVVFSSLALRLYKPPDIVGTASNSPQKYQIPKILRLGKARNEQEYKLVAGQEGAWSSDDESNGHEYFDDENLV